MLSRRLVFSHRAFSRTVPASAETVKNWLDGKEVESKANKWIDLTNPVCFYLFFYFRFLENGKL